MLDVDSRKSGLAALESVEAGLGDLPDTLRARTPGKVLLAGKSSVVIDGDHLVVSGLHFVDSDVTESAIVFKGNDNRVTDSAIVAPNRGGKWVHFRTGQRNRLDHCYIAGHAPKDVTLQVEVDEKLPNEHRIDHNHFGPRPPLGANGGVLAGVIPEIELIAGPQAPPPPLDPPEARNRFEYVFQRFVGALAAYMIFGRR